MTVPLLVEGRWAATNEILAHTPLVNGYGAKQVMTWLVTGQLFDAASLPRGHRPGRGRPRGRAWPLAHRRPTGRALVALLVMSLLLSFGRTTFGGLTVLLPGSKDIFMRRFMMGMQLAGLYLAGHGRWRRGPCRRARVRHGGGPRAAAWAAAPAAARGRGVGRRRWAVAVLAPAWTQIDAFAVTNAQWITAQHAADAAAGPRGRPPHRLRAAATGADVSYAGMPSNWGTDFTVGAVPVFKYLESRDVDEVGYTLRTASLMTDPEYFFDEDVPRGLRPLRRPLPDPARRPPLTGAGPPRAWRAGPYRLWVLPERRLRPRGRHRRVLSADKTNVGMMSVPYLRSDAPR